MEELATVEVVTRYTCTKKDAAAIMALSDSGRKEKLGALVGATMEETDDITLTVRVTQDGVTKDTILNNTHSSEFDG